ncbi:putative metaphase-anaphase transition protein [Neofusicoccum parvum UCRNP2]|uniref:Putative metaphase-anaphase transition protein n=1 Tax=Botryosphaeria parva (strain UCR-NP2) TaxID=1287680 RepID=R1E9K9_BOTPV|nr:putative metaphase-anaphase transition protein [Neofusicoccum parvum UCRNP2]
MAEDTPRKPSRSDSISQKSETSQTAQEFINSQLQLEADAREVLPYKAWSCLTCNPPPDDPSEPYTPAGVCYSCHVSCHGEHQLVELFAKRNFVCDCGTTRIQSDCPCTLRVNEATGIKGDVRAESPAPSNHYDHNYRNQFCGCGQDYDAHQEKGTMFQCLGLGTVEDGGCGEDWWHPECLVGLPRDWYKKETSKELEIIADGEATNDVKRVDLDDKVNSTGTNGSTAEKMNGHTAENAAGVNEQLADGSVGSRSLLDRGEAALSNMDRVRAIEGVMVYNHLKDKVKDFLKPFAESGRPVGAEDIKAYFERLRGDAEGIMAARGDAEKGGEGHKEDGEGGGDSGSAGRKEQSGY